MIVPRDKGFGTSGHHKDMQQKECHEVLNFCANLLRVGGCIGLQLLHCLGQICAHTRTIVLVCVGLHLLVCWQRNLCIKPCCRLDLDGTVFETLGIIASGFEWASLEN